MNVSPKISLYPNQRIVVEVNGMAITIDFVQHVPGVDHAYIDVTGGGATPLTVTVENEVVYE